MGGGGTRLLAAAPEGGEEAEPAAPPARHLSLRTGISGGSPGASVAGAERGRGRRPLRSLTPRPPPPLPPGSGPPGSASTRSHWPSRALREGRCRAPIGRGHGARAFSRQARPRKLLGNAVFPHRGAAGRGGRRVKTRSRRGLAVAAAAWRCARSRAEVGGQRLLLLLLLLVLHRDVARLPPVAVGPLPDRPAPPTASCRCRERPGGAGRGSGLRPAGR